MTQSTRVKWKREKEVRQGKKERAEERKSERRREGKKGTAFTLSMKKCKVVRTKFHSIIERLLSYIHSFLILALVSLFTAFNWVSWYRLTFFRSPLAVSKVQARGQWNLQSDHTRTGREREKEGQRKDERPSGQWNGQLVVHLKFKQVKEGEERVSFWWREKGRERASSVIKSTLTQSVIRAFLFPLVYNGHFHFIVRPERLIYALLYSMVRVSSIHRFSPQVKCPPKINRNQDAQAG